MRTISLYIRLGARVLAASIVTAGWFSPVVLHAQTCDPLGPNDVLILVNANSPVSRSVADLYRRYHPEIADNQVLYLGGTAIFPAGLPDSASLAATPAHEIITRAQFDNLIAQPVRDYLIGTGLVDIVYCLITTAGMPYRIEDSAPSLADVVYPGGSNPNLTVNNVTTVDAAAVEAELSVLFQTDPAITTSAKMPIQNRVVNPYQGYRSRIKCWAGTRDILTRRMTFNWTYLKFVAKSPRIEGQTSSPGSALGRQMSPADLYLTARLDGPRVQGEYPIFSVKKMLDRAAAAGDASFARFVGYNHATTDVVIDDSSNCCSLQSEAVYNLRLSALSVGDYAVDFNQYPVPPGGEDGQGSSGVVSGLHHDRAVQWLTGSTPGEVISVQPISVGLGGLCFWDGTNAIVNSGEVANLLGPGRGIIGLLGYGVNGSDGRPANYLLASGPSGGPLFASAPGAVFSSLESFNAVTLFTDASTGQAKIVDFIEIGGTAAVGHAFEPVSGSSGGLIQGDYLLRNLLRDDDGDGLGDLTLVEATFSAMPYLSWTAVMLGDPLMRLRLGAGGLVQTSEWAGDVDGDGYVGFLDTLPVLDGYSADIGAPLYDPRADLNQDGTVGWSDLSQILDNYNTTYP